MLKLSKIVLRKIVVHISLCWTLCTMASLRNLSIFPCPRNVKSTKNCLWWQSTARFRVITLKLETYVVNQNHTIAEHLRSCQPWFVIWNVDQQIFLPSNHYLILEKPWSYLQRIKWQCRKFDDISRHLELEAECCGVKHNAALVANPVQRKLRGQNMEDRGRMATKWRPIST